MLDVNRMAEFVEQSGAYCRPLDEATYFGRNKTLLECEELLDKMLELAQKEGVYGVSSSQFTDMMDIVSDKLGRLFGFYNFVINGSVASFIPQLGMMAMSAPGITLCKSAVVKYTQKATGGMKTWEIDFDKTHKGIQFKPGTRYCLRMWLGMELFLAPPPYNMSGGEILAIILHEIGHNFYVGPVRELGSQLLMYATAADLAAAINSLVGAIILSEGMEAIDNMLSPDARRGIVSTMNSLGAILQPLFKLQTVVNVVLSLVAIAIQLERILFGAVAIAAVRHTTALMSYDAEKYSDAFATSYGYGAELSSSLSKLGHIKVGGIKTTDKTQAAIDFVCYIALLPIRLINTIISPSPHPNTQGRLKNDIKYMESAGEAITNPRLRHEFNEQMQKMYTLREQTKQYSGANPVNNIEKIRAIVQDALNISDLKDLFTSLNPSVAVYKNLDMPG